MPRDGMNNGDGPTIVVVGPFLFLSGLGITNLHEKWEK